MIVGPDGVIASVIGKDMNERQAERRLQTGMTRINDRYYVDMIPVGSGVVGQKVKAKA